MIIYDNIIYDDIIYDDIIFEVYHSLFSLVPKIFDEDSRKIYLSFIQSVKAIWMPLSPARRLQLVHPDPYIIVTNTSFPYTNSSWYTSWCKAGLTGLSADIRADC